MHTYFELFGNGGVFTETKTEGIRQSSPEQRDPMFDKGFYMEDGDMSDLVSTSSMRGMYGRLSPSLEPNDDMVTTSLSLHQWLLTLSLAMRVLIVKRNSPAEACVGF